MPENNAFDSQTKLETSSGGVRIYGLERLDGKLGGDLFSLPFSIRVIVEALLRNCRGKFVEFYGEGLSRLSLPDRATIANMAPEYGATCSFFPVDAETTKYLLGTGRSRELADLVQAYRKEYGTGSSRDWAAKGSYLLGIRAVIAESFERIHRSNLVGMGVLPLQFATGENADSLGLIGKETYDVVGLAGISPGAGLTVRATDESGATKEFKVRARVDSPIEVEYLRNGGILQTVLRQLLREGN